MSGEIDAASNELFSTTLRRAWSPTADGKVDETLVIDAQDLEFISQRQLLNLDRYARTCAREVVLRTCQSIPARPAELIDLTHVRVEAPHDGAAVDAALGN